MGTITTTLESGDSAFVGAISSSSEYTIEVNSGVQGANIGNFVFTNSSFSNTTLTLALSNSAMVLTPGGGYYTRLEANGSITLPGSIKFTDNTVQNTAWTGVAAPYSWTNTHTFSNTVTINGDLTVNNYVIAANGATSAYATKYLVEYNPTTKDLTYSSRPDASRPYITGYGSEIHVSPVALDDSGNGTIGDPVKTIAQAKILAAAAFETTGVGQRKTIILHPGDYVENVTMDIQYAVLTSHELIGKNTTLTGTLTISKGCTISGLKMTNLAITANSSVGTVDMIGCTVSTATTRTSNAYTVFKDCDMSSATLSITGGGTVIATGGNYGALAVSNTAAAMLVKSVITLGPTTLTAGTLQIADTVIYAASNTANAITASAGSVLTLNNSQVLIPDLSNVARLSLAGYYSILHSVYDKTNSTFGGTSLSAIDYGQHVNVDKLIVGNTSVNVAITSTAISGNATGTFGNTTINGTLTATGNVAGNTAGFAIGYRDIPQNFTNTSFTLALTDAGKHILTQNSGASTQTVTIPPNGTVAFQTGAAITIVVQSTGTVAVANGAGVTMYLAGNSTAKSTVTLNSYSMATLLKIGTDTWMVSGTGAT